MQPPTLPEFICSIYDLIKPYTAEKDNEHESQLGLHSIPGFPSKVIEWLNLFHLDTSNESNAKSDELREKGNRLFRSNKTLNALAAARCYTSAILKATDGSRSLSLAHANRSAAIAEFGYYKEAYEDCQCAIDYGYPEENLQKIIVRQAYCANKLKDLNKLKQCVEKLRTMTLSEAFAKQKIAFERDLANLEEDNALHINTDRIETYLEQNIQTHPQKGRCMIASKDIDKGENILIEETFSFVVLKNSTTCSNCAAQNIIPFPCNVCSKVYYCSLKCKQSHNMVHTFECYVHRCNLLPAIGIGNLTLNVLLNGLPSILPSLQECTSYLSIWQKIKTIAKPGSGGYAGVLALVTNIDLLDSDNCLFYSVSAGMLTYYLKQFTAFYTLFDGTAASTFNWDIVVSALLFRHFTQMIANSNTVLTLICLDNSFAFSALTDIWSSPQHLKKGQLFQYSNVEVQKSEINPYLSLCNHSCKPSLRTKFDGVYVTAIARHPIRKGEEIFNTYFADNRHNTRSRRQSYLKSFYNFDCRCEYCLTNNDDVEFYKFHKYRCQSSKCEAIFSPPPEKLFFWKGDAKIIFLTCPVCGVKQNMEWVWRFEQLSESPTELKEFLRIIEFSERPLVGFSELRQLMSLKVVKLFFIFLRDGFQFARDEIEELGKVLNYALRVCEEKDDVESLVYTSMSIYAIELMAQGYFLDFDCTKIKESLKMLPTNLRTIFDNYIEDYIGDKFET